SYALTDNTDRKRLAAFTIGLGRYPPDWTERYLATLEPSSDQATRERPSAPRELVPWLIELGQSAPGDLGVPTSLAIVNLWFSDPSRRDVEGLNRLLRGCRAGLESEAPTPPEALAGKVALAAIEVLIAWTQGEPPRVPLVNLAQAMVDRWIDAADRQYLAGL